MSDNKYRGLTITEEKIMRQIKKILLFICMAVFLLPTPVLAEDTTEITATEEETEEPKKLDDPQGVVQILCGYPFEDGSFDTWYSVPGVAVTANTVITGYPLPAADDKAYYKLKEERAKGYETLGIDINGITELSYRICDDGNEMNVAELARTEDEISILTTYDPVASYAKLSAVGLSIGNNIRAAGFAANIFDTNYYISKTDLLVQTIEISGSTANGNAMFSTQTTNKYAALFSDFGYVIGLVTPGADITSAIAVSTVKEALSAAGISFEEGEPVEVIDYSKLEKVIKEARDHKKEDYSEYIYEDFIKTVENAEKMVEEGTADQPAIDEMTKTIRNNITVLENSNKTSPASLLITAIFVVILIALLVFFIIRIKKHPELIQEIGTHGFFVIFKKDSIAVNGKTQKKKGTSVQKVQPKPVKREESETRRKPQEKEQLKDGKEQRRNGKAGKVPPVQNTQDKKEQAGKPAVKTVLQVQEPTYTPGNLQQESPQQGYAGGQESPQQPGNSQQGTDDRQYRAQPVQFVPQPAQQNPATQQNEQQAEYEAWYRAQQAAAQQAAPQQAAAEAFQDVQQSTYYPPAVNVPFYARPITSLDDTSILATDQNQQLPAELTAFSRRAYIVQKRTGERTYIKSGRFTIGKSTKATLYIPGNSTVSRIHCAIACISGEYSIIDNESTNGTYVDGYKLPPMTYVPLINGSRIMLSNEELEFGIEGE